MLLLLLLLLLLSVMGWVFGEHCLELRDFAVVLEGDTFVWLSLCSLGSLFVEKVTC